MIWAVIGQRNLWFVECFPRLSGGHNAISEMREIGEIRAKLDICRLRKRRVSNYRKAEIKYKVSILQALQVFGDSVGQETFHKPFTEKEALHGVAGGSHSDLIIERRMTQSYDHVQHVRTLDTLITLLLLFGGCLDLLLQRSNV